MTQPQKKPDVPDVIDQPPVQETLIIVSEDETGSKDITIDKLTIKLPDNKGTVLLKDFSATIKQGEKIILTGESGAGKTTTVKGLLGKWDTGSGNVKIPKGMKVRAISQHVNLSNTTLRGILNLTPKDAYIFEDKELRAALLKVGLPKLVQHIPGQQVEMLMDEILDNARTIIDGFNGNKPSNADLAALQETLVNNAEQLTKEQFDVAQNVPEAQRTYMQETLAGIMKRRLGHNAPKDRAARNIADAVSGKIDETLAQLVVNGLQGAVKQSAYYNARAKVFWPRPPMTTGKAKYYSWLLRKNMHGKFKSYLHNKDTEDTKREIVLNKAQSKLLADTLTDDIKNEVMTHYVKRGGIKGALSFAFNLLSWPLDLVRLQFRAARTAKEMSQSLAFFMDRQVVKGDALQRQLSGGQLKKLMAARAILHKPDLLVMDEITTGVDDKSKRAIYQEILDALPPSTTVISILHDLELTDMHTMHAHLENKTLTLNKVDPNDPGNIPPAPSAP